MSNGSLEIIKKSYNLHNVLSERARGSSEGAGRAAETGKRESLPERGGRTSREEKGNPNLETESLSNIYNINTILNTAIWGQ